MPTAPLSSPSDGVIDDCSAVPAQTLLALLPAQGPHSLALQLLAVPCTVTRYVVPGVSGGVAYGPAAPSLPSSWLSILTVATTSPVVGVAAASPSITGDG